MAEQLHRRFHTQQVRSLLEDYLEVLGIKPRRFFALFQQYRRTPYGFSIQYTRKAINPKISKETKQHILKECHLEKELIEKSDAPIRWDNYSYIRDQLYYEYGQKRCPCPPS